MFVPIADSALEVTFSGPRRSDNSVVVPFCLYQFSNDLYIIVDKHQHIHHLYINDLRSDSLSFVHNIGERFLPFVSLDYPGRNVRVFSTREFSDDNTLIFTPTHHILYELY